MNIPKCYTDYMSVEPDEDHPIEAANWCDVEKLQAENHRLRESVRKAHERLYPWGSNIDYRAEPDIQKVLSILEHALEDTRGLQT